MSARARVLVPLLAVLVGLAFVDLGARILVARSAWRPLPPFGRARVQQEWLERSERELAEGRPPPGYSRFDPLLGWTAQAGHASADGRVHVNARGLRARGEYQDEVPPGKRRLLACGESFTFCEEVSDDEAWPARLEQLDPALEVWNYGVGGYGTDQALLRVTREARGPVEALLVGLMLENIGRNVNRYRPLWYPSAQPAAKPRYRLKGSGLELVEQPFATREDLVSAVRSGEVFALLYEHEHWTDGSPPAWLGWSAAVRLLAGARAYAARELEPLWSDTAGEPFLTTLALLEAFRDRARELGTERVLVLIFPMRQDLERLVEGGRRYWSTLLLALDARGLAHLDLSEILLAEARTSGLEGLYLDSHLSPRGNDLVARAVLDWLAPPGPQQR